MAPHDMSAMAPASTDSGEAHGVMAMTMTFVQSTATPLLWSSWQPNNTAEYAASCLFLIALAALTRVLVAIRPVLDAASWRRRAQYHRQEEENSTEMHPQPDTKNALPPRERPTGSKRAIMMAIRDHWSNAALSSRLARAAYDMVIAGLGYLVMLAVMTMNVGYFFSVLGGVFLGTFLLAVPASDAHRGSDDCG